MLYWLGFALGSLGSLVIGWATVATALYLRRLVGKPFCEILVDETELDRSLRRHSHQGHVVVSCQELPGGSWMISGR